MMSVAVYGRTTSLLFLLIALLISSTPSLAAETVTPDTSAAEIQFVFGSDTSSGGIRVDRYSMLFSGSAVEMYLSATGNAARIMDPSLRERLADSYGTPIPMTWWMQGGSIYHPAANTNVPVNSTLPLHLMLKYHGDAIRTFGDEMTFHYHTWVWSDYDADGRYYWNQAQHFDESRADFDRSLAQHLIEEDVFPVSFRSGWHFMDNAWQRRLDELMPFSMHNASPFRGLDQVEPLDNNYDWSRAPIDFVPYRPSEEDYQLPGGNRGWNVRSIYTKQFRAAQARDVFEAARDGKRQVVVIWSHLAEADFVEQIEDVVAAIREAAVDHPDVAYRFTTGVDAMQRWLETDDFSPPNLEVTLEDGRLTIGSNESLFQPAPFVAVKDVYERHHVVEARYIGTNRWETELPWSRSRMAKIAVAATDSSGNLTTRHLDLLPDDIFVDNESDGFAAEDHAWQRVYHTSADQVWGRDYLQTTLAPNTHATASFSTEVDDAGFYQLFVRTPDVPNRARETSVTLFINEAGSDSTHLDPFVSGQWVYAGAAEIPAGATVRADVSARADDEERSFAVDAIRLSPLVRDRQLVLGRTFLQFGDVMYGRTRRSSVLVRNLGTEDVSITNVYSASRAVELASQLPLVVPAMGSTELFLDVSSPEPDMVRDTVYVESDDPSRPVITLPFEARFTSYFTVVDNDDPQGYTESGNWNDSVTEVLGPSSRWAGTGSEPTATFSTSVDRAGTFDLSIIVPQAVNSATAAKYRIAVNDTPVDTVTIDQNDGSGAWRSLALVDLQPGDSLAATVAWAHTDQPGRVLRTDGLRLAHLGTELDELVADDEDGDVYAESGDWQTSVAEAYGYRSRYGSRDARAVFSFDVERSGLHAIEMIVPASENASRRARYRILRNGAAIDSVFADQNVRGGSWRLLGSYLLLGGDRLEVELTDADGVTPGSVLRADAVRMRFDASSPTGQDAVPDRTTMHLGPNYPHPVTRSSTFAYVVGEPTQVTIRLYDAIGRMVATVVNDHVQPGEHLVHFSAAGLSSGVYILRMESGGRILSRPVVVVR